MPTPNPQGWCPFADTRHKSPNFWSGNSGRCAAVLHIAQGSYEQSRTWLTSPASGVSSHFIIALDGALSQMVSIFDSAWANGLWWDESIRQWRAPREDQQHAPIVTPLWPLITPGVNPNRQTISVEHAGFTGDAHPPAMIDATVRLLRWLAEQFPLTYTPGRTLIRHADINPLDKPLCPGANFNLTQIASRASVIAVPTRRYIAIVPCPIFEARDPGSRVALGGTAVVPAGETVETDNLTAGWLHLKDQRGFLPLGALKEAQ